MRRPIEKAPVATPLATWLQAAQSAALVGTVWPIGTWNMGLPQQGVVTTTQVRLGRERRQREPHISREHRDRAHASCSKQTSYSVRENGGRLTFTCGEVRGKKGNWYTGTGTGPGTAGHQGRRDAVTKLCCRVILVAPMAQQVACIC